MNLEPSGTIVSLDEAGIFFSSVKMFKNTVQWFESTGFGSGMRV